MGGCITERLRMAAQIRPEVCNGSIEGIMLDGSINKVRGRWAGNRFRGCRCGLEDKIR